MPLHLELTLSEPDQPVVKDLSYFLADVSLLYDRLVLFQQNATQPILYAPGFYRRTRRLPPEFELEFGWISRHFPLQIELIVGTAGGILLAAKTFAEILRLIRDWSHERDRQKLENLKSRIEIIERLEALRRASPEYVLLLEKDIRRTLGNPIRVLEVSERDIRRN